MAGQSDPQLALFSAEEVEFVAEDEMVEIVPNMRMDPLHLICGDYGPFYPQLAAEVPLWLAIALKKRGKCAIRPPEWMSVDLLEGFVVKGRTPDRVKPNQFRVYGAMVQLALEKLTQVLEAERESQGAFQILPFHYVEISKLLFDHARDDVPDMYLVRSLVEDIRDVRFHKVETSLESIDTRTSAVKIKDLSAMEVNIVRPFVGRALQAIYKHGNPELVPDQDRTTNVQPQGQDHGQRRPLRRR